MKRRSKKYETEETVELGTLLGNTQDPQWADEIAFESDDDQQYVQDEYPEAYLDGYQDFYSDEYSDEHEAADIETRFHLAMGLFDLISIIIGIAVILVLVGMLVTLFNWLKTDIVHSALFLQSGLN